MKQVLFYGRGWRNFATSNGLVEGDRLIFALRAVSSFEVFIFQNGVKTAVPGEYVPMQRAQTSQTSPDESCGCKSENTNSVSIVSDVLAKKRIAKKRIAEEKVADSTSEVRIKTPLVSASNFIPDWPQNCPPNWPNHFGLGTIGTEPPVDLRYDHKLRMSFERSGDGLSSIKRKSHDFYEDRHNARPLPSFLKVLTVDNYLHYLEIPCSFTRIWGSKLRSFVKLQGICEGSAERIVACIWGKDKQRLFFTDGWREFHVENHLRAGLALGFTPIADSFFVVRGFQL